MAFIQVALKTSQDRIKVFNALKGQSVTGRPVRNLVLSTDQLKTIKEAGIPVYPVSANGKNDFRKKLDIDSVIKHHPD
ncbi:unnamed protein product [marine sediment metagenome]|uniref:Uncharacterized protein n=1 Tax=marine sediment metagenome TaxID=412755 RepID=X1IHB3_9ZZZZ